MKNGKHKYDIPSIVFGIINIGVILIYAFSIVPFLYINQWVWGVFSELGILHLLIKAMTLIVSFGLFLFTLPVMILFGRLFFQLFGVNVVEGEFSLRSKKGMYWWVYNAFLTSALRFTHIVNIPSVNKWVLILLGAKIGKKTTISGEVYDPHFIRIGKNTLLSHAVISAHSQQDGKVIVKRVRIGNNCLVGYGTIIGPGAVVDDNVIIGAGSFVPIGKHLTKGVWAGTPVKKLK